MNKKSIITIAVMILIIILGVSMSMLKTPKSKVEKRIHAWYEKHPETYHLDITRKSAIAKTARYHPERADEVDDLIIIEWKGMKITLAFDKPIKEIDWNKDSLETHFSYIVLDDIYHELSVKGWDIAPKTPQSSTSKGVTFKQSENEEIAFDLDWETYAFYGTSTSAKCRAHLQIADASLPEKCYISVPKKQLLHLDVNVALIQK